MLCVIEPIQWKNVTHVVCCPTVLGYNAAPEDLRQNSHNGAFQLIEACLIREVC